MRPICSRRIGVSAAGRRIGIALDQSGINRIGLRQHSLRAAKVLNPRWIGDGQWKPSLLQGQAHREMIGSSGFTNYLDGSSEFLDVRDKLAMAFFGIGELPAVTFKSHHEHVFGDIDSEVADLGLQCDYTLPWVYELGGAWMPGIRLW